MNDDDNIDKNSSEEFLICDLVNVIYKSYRNYLIYKLADLNITPAQIPFILELLRTKKASQDELAKKLFLTRGTAAKTLKKLDDEKIIERKIAINNRRKYDVYLTEKGKETASKIEKIDKSWENMVFSYLCQLENFNDNEKENVINLLKNLAKSSMEVFAHEREKTGDLSDFDDSNNSHRIHPFSEFLFRSHHFEAIGAHRDLFRKKGYFGNDHGKKF